MTSTASPVDPLGLGIAPGSQWGNLNNPSHPSFTHPDPSPSPNQQDEDSTPPTLGFKFSEPKFQIDWKLIAEAPISLIERTGDISSLAKYLPMIALGDVTPHSSSSDSIAHPTLITAFKSTQLITQYLLNCQSLLEGQFNTLNEELVSLDKVERKLKSKLRREIGRDDEHSEEGRKDEHGRVDEGVDTRGRRVKSNSRRSKVGNSRIHLLTSENKHYKKVIRKYHALLRLRNPTLARRIVTHGDGGISLIAKDDDRGKENQEVNGGLEYYEDEDEEENDEEDDFYQKRRNADEDEKVDDEDVSTNDVINRLRYSDVFKEKEVRRENDLSTDDSDGDDTNNVLKSSPSEATRKYHQSSIANAHGQKTNNSSASSSSLFNSKGYLHQQPTRHSSSSHENIVGTSPRKSSSSPSSSPYRNSRNLTPEGLRLRSSLTEIYSDEERGAIMKGLSPKQRESPIFEGLKESGSIDGLVHGRYDDDDDDDDDE